jgi:hypothetical protein
VSDSGAARGPSSGETIGGSLDAGAAAILIAAMLRLLADLATPARALVSAANALLSLERQRLAARIGLAGLLAEEVRLGMTAALTRVLADESAPARTTIAAANALLALERNRLRAERHQRKIAELAEDMTSSEPDGPERLESPARRHPPPSPRGRTETPRASELAGGEAWQPAQPGSTATHVLARRSPASPVRTSSRGEVLPEEVLPGEFLKEPRTK